MTSNERVIPDTSLTLTPAEVRALGTVLLYLREDFHDKHPAACAGMLLQAYKRAFAGMPAPQAPIARLMVANDGFVSWTHLLAPGLPEGMHDLYCEPESVAPYLRRIAEPYEIGAGIPPDGAPSMPEHSPDETPAPLCPTRCEGDKHGPLTSCDTNAGIVYACKTCSHHWFRKYGDDERPSGDSPLERHPTTDQVVEAFHAAYSPEEPSPRQLTESEREAMGRALERSQTVVDDGSEKASDERCNHLVLTQRCQLPKGHDGGHEWVAENGTPGRTE